MLEVTGLSVRRGGVLALEDVALSVGRGEIVGLIGPNGAGKTTLFDAVSGLVDIQAGSIRLDGEELRTRAADRRSRSGIGRTFQTPQLPASMTVMECLLLGAQARLRTGLIADGLRLPWSRRAEVLGRREAVRVAGLLGIEAHLGRRAAELPLGILRLVEIGRAVCGSPRVLLLDEAVSGISREDAASLGALVRRLRDHEEVAVLAVEHDVDFVLGACDFVYVLDHGRLIARGTPATVRRDPRVIAAYLGDEARARGEVDHAAAG